MKTLAFVLAVVSLTLGAAAPARADNVQLELEAMAKQVAAGLNEQKQIRIGKFTGHGNLPTAFGPEIQRLLGQELVKLKIAIDPTAQFEISGNYRPADKDPANPGQTETFVRINAQLVDTKSGEPVDSLRILSRAVYSNEVLARVAAVPVSIPPDATRKQENDEIRQRIDKPEFHAQGTRIASKEGSPFSVEVLVVGDKEAANPEAGAPVAKTKEGLPFVQIQQNQFYRLRIHNNADFDAAVKISIDGLDQFVFSDKDFRKEDGSPKHNYRFVPKGKSIVVSGWFRTLKDFDYFVVTEYARSASAELKRDPDEAGQIALQFYACWKDDASKPADEPKGGRSANDATGRVPGGKDDLKEVSVTVGVQRDVIGIRYGSKQP